MRIAARTLILVVGLLAATSGCTSHRTAPAPPATSAHPSAAALPAAQAANLQTRLASTDPTIVGTVLAPGLAKQYAAHPFAMLPPGSRVQLDAAGMFVSGGLATVPARIEGSDPGSWLLLLTNVNGSWLVYGTVKQ